MTKKSLFFFIFFFSSLYAMENQNGVNLGAQTLNSLSILQNIDLIESFMQGKIIVPEESILYFEDCYGNHQCENFDNLKQLITYVENKNLSLLSADFKSQNQTKEFKNFYPFELIFAAQLVRLKEFIETKRIDPRDDFETLYQKIQELKKNQGDQFMQEMFGSSDIDEVTPQIINCANNRVEYINFCKNNECEAINKIVHNPFHFRFVTWQEYLRKSKNI